MVSGIGWHIAYIIRGIGMCLPDSGNPMKIHQDPNFLNL